MTECQQSTPRLSPAPQGRNSARIVAQPSFWDCCPAEMPLWLEPWLPRAMLDPPAVPAMDRRGRAGIARPRSFLHGKRGHGTPGETLAIGLVKPLMFPQPVPPGVLPPQALASEASLFARLLQGSEGTGCCVGPSCPTSSSRPRGEHAEKGARAGGLVWQPQPSARSRPGPAAAAFPRISRSLLLLSGFPSPCPLPDPLVFLDTSCVRSVLRWRHQAQASKSSFTDSAETSGEEPCPAHAGGHLPCGSLPIFSAFQY